MEQELSQVWEVENTEFCYRVLQQEILEKRVAYIQVEYSVDGEYLPLVERNTRQALRNGARTVYLSCFDKAEEEGECFEAGEFLFLPCSVEVDGVLYRYVCYIEDYGD